MTRYTRTAADAIHHSTKHGTPAAHPQRLVSYPRLDPGNAPTPLKEYRDLPVSPLSRDLVGSTPPAVRVLSGERGDPSPLDASLLATLLYLTAGVTRATAGSGGGRVFFRAAMSAGNLHPVEVYVIAGPNVDGVPAGVHHFAPLEFGLTELRRGDFRAALSITAPVALVFTGLVWRTTTHPCLCEGFLGGVLGGREVSACQRQRLDYRFVRLPKEGLQARRSDVCAF